MRKISNKNGFPPGLKANTLFALIGPTEVRPCYKASARLDNKALSRELAAT
jgi:hypothetical protein